MQEVNSIKLVAVMLFCVTAATGCSLSGSDTYTLYRNSPIDANMRIHVASFDTKDGDAYNNENCALAAKLFQAQPGTVARFWCEKGAFRK